MRCFIAIAESGPGDGHRIKTTCTGLGKSDARLGDPFDPPESNCEAGRKPGDILLGEPHPEERFSKENIPRLAASLAV